ncbi:hypothetical protein CEQ90_10230 [Lewinellaceae bacterium SD302]|nr:hypothetical protein CEQ90_10230 [Lewinellaceae bacterium SD302]
MLSDVNHEYQSREEEMLDGWRGTLLGILVVVILALAFREFLFSRAYLGSAGLVSTGIKAGIAITFAVGLFFIKDAVGYNQLEKVRFGLFSLLLSCVFATWFLAWSNRIFPATLASEPVEVEVVRLKNNQRIGSDEGELAYVDAAVVLVNNVAMSVGRTEKNKYPTIRIKGQQANDLEAGSKITARLYHGRWGQDFILAAE